MYQVRTRTSLYPTKEKLYSGFSKNIQSEQTNPFDDYSNVLGIDVSNKEILDD